MSVLRVKVELQNDFQTHKTTVEHVFLHHGDMTPEWAEARLQQFFTAHVLTLLPGSDAPSSA